MTTRGIVILASCAVALAVAAFVFVGRFSSPKSVAVSARENMMELLGARIAKLRPDANVLALGNPFSKESGYFDERRQFEQAGLRGLRQGLGGRAEVKVLFPRIRPEYLANPQSVVIPPDSRTPLSFLIEAASVEELADAHPEYRVIVSLIGLPMGIDRLKLWSQEDARCFALLLPDLRLLGSPAKTVEAFQQGKLLAVVVEDSQQPSEPLIVTRENIQAVLQRQPKVFGF